MALTEHCYSVLLVSASDKLTASLRAMLPCDRYDPVVVTGDVASARKGCLQQFRNGRFAACTGRAFSGHFRQSLPLWDPGALQADKRSDPHPVADTMLRDAGQTAADGGKSGDDGRKNGGNPAREPSEMDPHRRAQDDGKGSTSVYRKTGDGSLYHTARRRGKHSIDLFIRPRTE